MIENKTEIYSIVDIWGFGASVKKINRSKRHVTDRFIYRITTINLEIQKKWKYPKIHKKVGSGC